MKWYVCIAFFWGSLAHGQTIHPTALFRTLEENPKSGGKFDFDQCLRRHEGDSFVAPRMLPFHIVHVTSADLKLQEFRVRYKDRGISFDDAMILVWWQSTNPLLELFPRRRISVISVNDCGKNWGIMVSWSGERLTLRVIDPFAITGIKLWFVPLIRAGTYVFTLS